MSILKKILMSAYLIFFLSLSGVVNANETNLISKPENIQKIELIKNNFNLNELRLVDCTIKIKTDGMELEITFHDVSRFRCALIKVGKWFQDTF